mgnify:CR=1 FL=1
MMFSSIRNKIRLRLPGLLPYSRFHSGQLVESGRKYVVNGIMIFNGVVFLGWYKSETDYRLRQFMFRNFTVSSDGILKKFRLHTLLTSCFSHRDGMHLLFNGVCFYSFANTALAMLNPLQFAALFLGSGLVGNIVFLVPWSKILPRNFQSFQSRYYSRWYGDLLSTNRLGLGASGAVNGLIMWTVCTFPRSMLYIYGIVPVPAVVAGAGIFGCTKCWRGAGT